MQVSVIIPTYNKAPFIREAIDSVLAQTFKDLEILVIDDGSTDETAAVLKSYLDTGQISYFYQANQGPSAARNKGLAQAKGQYIKFLDSDDFLYPEQIEKQIRDIEQEPGVISITDCVILKLNGSLEKRPVKLPGKDKQLASFIESNRGVIHAFLVPKPLLDRVGGFDGSLTCSEDTDLWIRILATGASMKHLPMTGCCYRMLKTGISDNTENMFFQKIKIYEKVNQSYLKQDQTPPFLMDSLLAVNAKLLEESKARKIDPTKHLPNTLKMTDKIYDLNSKGALRWLYKAGGIRNYLNGRYLFKCLTKKNYRYNLLHHNYSWRYL